MVIQHTEPLDKVFHALGDRTRREMLGLLAKNGECTASELGKPFQIAQPTASKHIRVLEEAELVSRSIDGRTHRFRLETGRMDQAASWISRHKKFWLASFDALEECINEISDQKGTNK